MKKGKRRMDDTGDPNQKKKKNVYEMSTKLIGFVVVLILNEQMFYPS